MPHGGPLDADADADGNRHTHDDDSVAYDDHNATITPPAHAFARCELPYQPDFSEDRPTQLRKHTARHFPYGSRGGSQEEKSNTQHLQNTT